MQVGGGVDKGELEDNSLARSIPPKNPQWQREVHMNDSSMIWTQKFQKPLVED